MERTLPVKDVQHTDRIASSVADEVILAKFVLMVHSTANTISQQHVAYLAEADREDEVDINQLDIMVQSKTSNLTSN